jgi:signal transduction histidine kinase
MSRNTTCGRQADIASGIGLGPWGSRQIIEQHGGTLSVISREGEGSTFTVRLPLTKATPDSH